MLDISPDKIIVFLVIAFVVLGPGHLGEAARALGRAREQLRQFTSGLPPEAEKLIRNPRGALLDVLDEPRRGMQDAAGVVKEIVTGAGKEVVAPRSEHEHSEEAR
jgi:Sec-independent protein translocase protein TatA